MKKVITVALPKGGVGKTTTAVNLAVSLAIAEKRTLLIDMDPSGSCSVSMGLKDIDIKGGVFNLISFNKSLDNIIHKSPLEFLDFIPFNTLTHQEEERLQLLSNNAMLLFNLLSKEILSYDFIIFDCPPYLKGLTTMAIAASNSIVIPVKPANYSISALKKMMKYIEWIKTGVNKDIYVEGILMTLFEKNTKVSALTEKKLYDKYGEHCFRTIIPKSTIIAESTFYGKPAILVNAKAPGCEAYLKLAQELIVRNKVCPIVKDLAKNNLLKMSSTSINFELNQNYPNPFNPNTSIKFSIAQPGRTTLKVFNVFGTEIDTVVDENLECGDYEIKWTPNGFPSGVYQYKIECGSFSETRKMIYAK